MREELRRRVAADEFLGYEKFHSKNLMEKLPRGKWDFDDVLAFMRVFAIEAADAYDPAKSKGAKFETYLYKHLYLRCLQWKNWDWLKMNHPEGKSVSPFSYYEAMSEDGIFDPSQAHNVRPTLTMELSDLLDILTPDARRMLTMILGVSSEELCNAFRSGPVVVSNMLGCDVAEMESFIREIRTKAPECVCGL